VPVQPKTNRIKSTYTTAHLRSKPAICDSRAFLLESMLHSWEHNYSSNVGSNRTHCNSHTCMYHSTDKHTAEQRFCFIICHTTLLHIPKYHSMLASAVCRKWYLIQRAVIKDLDVSLIHNRKMQKKLHLLI